MPDYRAPLRDMQFVLFDVFQSDQQWTDLELEEINRELADAILDEGARITQSLMAPLSAVGHEAGVKWDDGKVTTPPGFAEAYAELAQGGWGAMAGDPEYGGQLMPKSLVLLFEEMMYASNISLGLYLSLTSGAALALSAHASEELKAIYLPPMYDGRWAGSMCLTEAHAGTDLGMIRTRAVPNADNSYAISGTKIFITGGEHDLTENIVHLVLAKLPDAPAGSRGISLFLVPKRKVNADGSLGESNGVSCGSVEHKMGINASATCVLNFDNAEGYLVGEVNKGLAAMFTMMNYERLSVGIQGLGAASKAFQWSLEYATDRIQGRSPSGPVNSDGAADPIIVHPDVRRMLLTQKAYVEAGRAFAVYVGQQLDAAKFGEGEIKQRAQSMVDLLTPIAKAFLTDKGFDGTVLGQQIFGGHGYIREWGMEQLVRDVRISQIYEGTNGVQALDLMGRKIVANAGKSLALLLEEIRAFIESAHQSSGMREFTDPLESATDNLLALANDVISAAANDPYAVGAASNDFLHVTGLTLYAWMWARMAQAALTAGEGDVFYQTKLQTARFYMQRILPQANALSATVRAGSSSLMVVSSEGLMPV